MGDRPGGLEGRLRPLASLLPEAIRSRLAFALAYSTELSLPVGSVFLRECSSEGRALNRAALAAAVSERLERIGLDLDPRTDPGAIREVLLAHEYERPGFVPSADTTVLDVGAQHGEYAVLCAVKYGAQVMAFEPIASNCEVIRENLRRNGSPAVTVYPFALGDFDGPLAAYRYDTMLVREPGRFPTRGLRVGQRRLDSLFLEKVVSTRRVIIKVDVEGFEREVLEGAARFIDRFRPLLIVETDRARRGAIEDLLRRDSYAVSHVEEKATGVILFATPTASALVADRE